MEFNFYNFKKYQNTLELILLKALKDTLNITDVEIIGSFNKGLYFKLEDSISEEEVKSVKEKMEEIKALNIPITYKEDKAILDDYSTKLIGGVLANSNQICKFNLKKYLDGVLLTYPNYLDENVLIDENQVKLSKMFIDSYVDAKKINCTTIEELNNYVRNGKIKDLINLQEEIHENNLYKIASEIIESKRRVVLICGPSSSGKTSTAKRLCNYLNSFNHETLYMGTDDYYVEKQDMPKGKDGQNNYECIEAIDVELFQKNINDLINGEIVDLPIFNFETMHKEYGKNYKKISKDTIIVIEGILTLNKKLSSSIAEEDKYKIYISPVSPIKIDNLNRISNTELRLVRRICRDARSRNVKATRTIELWPKVRDGEEENIYPYIDEANIIFNTYCLYEGVVLGRYIKPLLKDIAEDSLYYEKAKELLSLYERYEDIDIEDEKLIPNNSILREFIGGSILVD